MRDKKDYLVCRFCGWKTRVWTTTRGGKRRHGSVLLLEHVSYKHEEEYDKIQKWLGEEKLI